MTWRSLPLALLAPVLLAAPVRAAEPPDMGDMTGVFDAFCLRAFPDDGALDRLATERQARPVSPEQVKSSIGVDAGRGWYLTTPAAEYFVVVERPHNQSCSVRRLTVSGMPSVQPLQQALKSFAVAHGERLVPGKSETKTLPNGVTVNGTSLSMTQQGPHLPTDFFFIFNTDYHGKSVGELSKAPGAQGSVEVRFQRTINADANMVPAIRGR